MRQALRRWIGRCAAATGLLALVASALTASPAQAAGSAQASGSAQATGSTQATSSAQPATHPPVRVPDSLAQRLQPCTLCHGAEGRAGREGYLPRIAGKPAAYLYQQLLNFRDGRRANAAMADLLALQSDAYLSEMAGYFAALSLPHAPPPQIKAAPQVLARGQALALQGDAERKLPACSACHGASLGGRWPAVPSLLGLPRDYLIGQLGSWRTGSRRAVAPDCMAQISRRLSAADIGAVAAWLAAQAVPAGQQAEAPGMPPPPMDCGAIPQPGA